MIVDAVSVRDVVPLIDALTAEPASSGYDQSEMFGYSVEKLEDGGVHLVGASVKGVVVGIGGVEIADDGTAELKRFYVIPEHRGSGAASAIITKLLAPSASSVRTSSALRPASNNTPLFGSTPGMDLNTSNRSGRTSAARRQFAWPARRPPDHRPAVEPGPRNDR